MAKRVKYMETGAIGVVSDAVAEIYAKKKYKEGKEIKVLGEYKPAVEEPKKDKADK